MERALFIELEGQMVTAECGPHVPHITAWMFLTQRTQRRPRLLKHYFRFLKKEERENFLELT